VEPENTVRVSRGPDAARLMRLAITLAKIAATALAGGATIRGLAFPVYWPLTSGVIASRTYEIAGCPDPYAYTSRGSWEQRLLRWSPRAL
jgi:hypothetical protein